MKYIINKKDMKRNWVLDKWPEKLVYVVGFFYTICWIIGFVFGFLFGLAK